VYLMADYDDIDSTEVRGIVGSGIYQRKKRDTSVTRIHGKETQLRW